MKVFYSYRVNHIRPGFTNLITIWFCSTQHCIIDQSRINTVLVSPSHFLNSLELCHCWCFYFVMKNHTQKDLLTLSNVFITYQRKHWEKAIRASVRPIHSRTIDKLYELKVHSILPLCLFGTIIFCVTPAFTQILNWGFVQSSRPAFFLSCICLELSLENLNAFLCFVFPDIKAWWT